MEYQESEAIKAMRAAVPAERAARYSDDELQGVIDIIWDWYEDNGWLEVDAAADDSDDLDRDALVKHVVKLLRADKDGVIDPADAKALVDAELDYEELVDRS